MDWLNANGRPAHARLTTNPKKIRREIRAQWKAADTRTARHGGRGPTEPVPPGGLRRGIRETAA